MDFIDTESVEAAEGFHMSGQTLGMALSFAEEMAIEERECCTLASDFENEETEGNVISLKARHASHDKEMVRFTEFIDRVIDGKASFDFNEDFNAFHRFDPDARW